jgi:hypothetical protein
MFFTNSIRFHHFTADFTDGDLRDKQFPDQGSRALYTIILPSVRAE